MGRGEASRYQLLGRPIDVPEHLPEGAIAAIRPEKVLVNASEDGVSIVADAIVRQAMFIGRELQLSVEVPQHGLLDALTQPNVAMASLKPGDKVRIGLHREDLLFYAPGETGVSVP